MTPNTLHTCTYDADCNVVTANGGHTACIDQAMSPRLKGIQSRNDRPKFIYNFNGHGLSIRNESTPATTVMSKRGTGVLAQRNCAPGTSKPILLAPDRVHKLPIPDTIVDVSLSIRFKPNACPKPVAVGNPGLNLAGETDSSQPAAHYQLYRDQKSRPYSIRAADCHLRASLPQALK